MCVKDTFLEGMLDRLTGESNHVAVVSQLKKIKILVLEPFYGGSHRAFLDCWHNRSQHDWTLLTLPATKWKWRMRHAAVTLAKQAAQLVRDGSQWDLVLATDMLNLAEFKGLISPKVAQLPAVAYFHENQLTYPTQADEQRGDQSRSDQSRGNKSHNNQTRDNQLRDYHFAMSNIVTCLAADQVWFNSAFHRDSFVTAVREWLARMPDNRLPGTADTINQCSRIMPQGYEAIPERPARKPGPLRILWSARWEHDKNPDDFFAALRQLRKSGVVFRLNVIGQQFANSPAVFEQARNEFGAEIDRWGYQATRGEYVACLLDADVVISTAHHEFFGVAVIEAIAAGARPLLPNRLAYPEILGGGGNLDPAPFLFDGTVSDLVNNLQNLSAQIESRSLQNDDFLKLQRHIRRFEYGQLVPRLDRGLEKVFQGGAARNNLEARA